MDDLAGRKVIGTSYTNSKVRNDGALFFLNAIE